MRIHPSLRELSRLADRELDENRQREVHGHLGECQRCRDQVVLMRDLGRAARSISHPSPPEDALSRILERRAAGDRVILPVSAALRSSHRRKAIGIAAGIGGTLLAATLLLLPANEATAGASDLRFDPVQPVPGDHIEVTYLPTSALAAEDILYLRGAFRSPGDPAPRRGLPGAVRVELHPHPDGTFSGTVQMPPEAVFGYFAVENRVASEIDVKEERFWAILAHDDGVPTREALREQLAVIGRTDVEFGLMAADTLLKYYPDDVVGWDRKLSYQKVSTVGAEHADVLVKHGAKLNELSNARELLQTDDLAELVGLWRYAMQLNNVALVARWGGELELTEHTVAAQVRLAAELADKDVPHQLEVYEREWMRAGLSDDHIASHAFSAAIKGQSPEAVFRWARRLSRVRPDEMGTVTQGLAEFPSLREPAKDGIRSEVHQLETPPLERRELGETMQERYARDQKDIRQLYGTLGRLLLEEGQYEAAIDTLELAVAGGWNPEAFRSYAEAFAALGDTSESLSLFAYVVAGEPDEVARSDLQASLKRRFGPKFNNGSDWTRRVQEAELQIARWRIAEAGARITPAGSPRVRDRDGQSRPLTSLFAGDVAIVVFWAGKPPMLTSVLGEGPDELSDQRGPGIEVIAITENQPSAELDRILDEQGVSHTIFYDHEWEVARSLKAIGVPYFYVVDQRGRFYFAEDMEQAIRLAESLQRTAAATT